MAVAGIESVPCYNCGFPIAILSDSDRVKCPWCGVTGIITTATVDLKVVLAALAAAVISVMAIQQHYRGR